MMFKPGTTHEDFLVDHNIIMFGNYLSVIANIMRILIYLCTLKISCMC